MVGAFGSNSRLPPRSLIVQSGALQCFLERNCLGLHGAVCADRDPHVTGISAVTMDTPTLTVQPRLFWKSGRISLAIVNGIGIETSAFA